MLREVRTVRLGRGVAVAGGWLTVQIEPGEGGVLLDSGSKRLPRRVPEVVTCQRSGRVGGERWLQLGGVCEGPSGGWAVPGGQ